jgi:hypothetical protein
MEVAGGGVWAGEFSVFREVSSVCCVIVVVLVACFFGGLFVGSALHETSL